MTFSPYPCNSSNDPNRAYMQILYDFISDYVKEALDVWFSGYEIFISLI